MRITIGLAVTTIALAACGRPSQVFHQPINAPGKPTAAFPDGWPDEKAASGKVKANPDDDEFAAAKTAGTADAYSKYLLERPKGKHRQEAIDAGVATVTKMPEGAGRDDALATLIDAAPEAGEKLPPEAVVNAAGPRGMRVKDILAIRESKSVGDEVISAKINQANKAYRDFSLPELALLKKLGVPDGIVKAMVDVTAKVESERRAKQERDALKGEIDDLRKFVEGKKAGGPAGAPEGEKSITTKEGVVDLATCAAKKLAAMKLCEQIPWPGSTACQSSADSNFPCGDVKHEESAFMKALFPTIPQKVPVPNDL